MKVGEISLPGCLDVFTLLLIQGGLLNLKTVEWDFFPQKIVTPFCTYTKWTLLDLKRLRLFFEEWEFPYDLFPMKRYILSEQLFNPAVFFRTCQSCHRWGPVWEGGRHTRPGNLEIGRFRRPQPPAQEQGQGHHSSRLRGSRPRPDVQSDRRTQTKGAEWRWVLIVTPNSDVITVELFVLVSLRGYYTCDGCWPVIPIKTLTACLIFFTS